MAIADYFLKIDGIDGESGDSKHKGEIEVDSFSFGAHQAGTSGHGGGAGAGKVSMSDISFTAKVSKASPKLALACANGEHIKKAVLLLRKAGKDQQEFYKITLEDVLVSSYQIGGANHSNHVPVDQFSLNYSQIEWEYKEQKPDGTLGGTVKAGWNVKKNTKVGG
jgi:type VI secretion system secreted protein Hcp